MSATPKADRTTPIAFRLSDDKQRRLNALASAEGLSSGEYARELVLTKIDEQEIINQEVQQLRTEFQTFRSDFALAVEALLVAASNKHPLTAEQARQWVGRPNPPTLKPSKESLTMLSVSAMSGGQGAYYTALAREDYYLEGGEPPGLWTGHSVPSSGTFRARSTKRISQKSSMDWIQREGHLSRMPARKTAKPDGI